MVDWFVKKGMHQFVATFWETTGFGIFLRDFCGIFLRDFCDFHLSLGVWLAQFAEIFPKSTRISPKIRGSFGNIPGKLGKNMNKTHHFPSQRPRFRAPGAPSAPASARDQWPWQWLQIPKASPGFRMVVSCGWTILIGHPKWIAPVLGWIFDTGVFVELWLRLTYPYISYINEKTCTWIICMVIHPTGGTSPKSSY